MEYSNEYAMKVTVLMARSCNFRPINIAYACLCIPTIFHISGGELQSSSYSLLLCLNVLVHQVVRTNHLQLWPVSHTLWLFNIAMENGPFIDEFPIKTSICKGFSMAMLNNRMVYVIHH